MTTPPVSPPAGAPGFGWALVRADGVIAAADADFAARFGAGSATALLGRPWRDLVTPEGQRTVAEIERTVRAGRAWRGRLAGRSPGGAVDLEVEATASGQDASIALRVIAPAPTAPTPDGGAEVSRASAAAGSPDASTPEPSGHEAAPTTAAPPLAAQAEPAPQPAPEPVYDEIRERPPQPEPAAELSPTLAPAPPPSPPASPASSGATRRVLEAAAHALALDWAVVLWASDAGRTIEVVEAYPEGFAGATRGVRWSPPDAGERAVLESGEPALEGALAVHRGDSSPLARLPAYGMRSALRVPLFAGGEVTGLVAAYSTRSEAFTIDDALRLERAVRGIGSGAGAESAPEARTPQGRPPAEPPSRPEAPSMAEQFDRLGTLSEVVAGVAHELNNPLTAVVGYAQALASLPPAERGPALEIIEREALRAGRIVRNLLTFAQRHPPELTAVDLNAVLQRVLDFKRYALQMDNVAIEVAHTPLPELRGDEHQLEQALLNLVNNAHQAMTPGGGTLRVRTVLEGGRARVVVEDTGPGVPPELASRIFDPFFTTRDVGGGMGLGLAVVFGTVAAHRGRVWVEGAPGGGARFVIELPVAGGAEGDREPAVAPTTAAPPATPGAPRGAGQRVLVVDDEEPIRALASQVLGTFGYEPAAAASATEALALLEAQAFEAVITDVRMPGMDGIALYREIARRWPALAGRVVIMTGDVENVAVAGLLRERGLASLEKPFRLESLLATLASVVGSPASDS